VEVDPKGSDAFAWAQGPLGRTLVARALAPAADAWFTTRDLALSGASDAAQGWDRLAAAIRVDEDRVMRLTQVHGAAVAVRARGAQSDTGRPRADAAATDDPDLALVVQTADCVPVLIADAGGRAVAAVHAGWRGTAAGVVSAAVETLERRFGVPPARLIAAIGPSIGPCCYRVGPDVERAFAERGVRADAIERWFIRDVNRLTLDLWRANRDQLVARGVSPRRVHAARLCTSCHPALFHSYRRDDGGTGRMAAVVRLTV
jgi:YfiH family protein